LNAAETLFGWRGITYRTLHDGHCVHPCQLCQGIFRTNFHPRTSFFLFRRAKSHRHRHVRVVRLACAIRRIPTLKTQALTDFVVRCFGRPSKKRKELESFLCGRVCLFLFVHFNGEQRAKQNCAVRKTGTQAQRTKTHLNPVESTKVSSVRAQDRTSLYDSKGVAGANRTSKGRTSHVPMCAHGRVTSA
jgi:hypothetical protein